MFLFKNLCIEVKNTNLLKHMYQSFSNAVRIKVLKFPCSYFDRNEVPLFLILVHSFTCIKICSSIPHIMNISTRYYLYQKTDITFFQAQVVRSFFSPLGKDRQLTKYLLVIPFQSFIQKECMIGTINSLISIIIFPSLCWYFPV